MHQELKLPVHSKPRCNKCQDILRSCFHWKTKPSSESFESKTAYDSHTKLSTLSRAELIARAKNLHKVVAQSQKKAKRYYSLYLKEKQKNVKAPKNFQPKSSDLAKLMDIAIENHWLVENSVLYALLTNSLTSLKKQEEEFAKEGKLTKNKQTGKAYITEGNHRLWVAIQEGIPLVPSHVIPHWLPPNGSYKKLEIYFSTLKFGETILPEKLGLTVAQSRTQ